MIHLRKLLFAKRLKQRDILLIANKSTGEKVVHQSRLSKIVNGTMQATEYEKFRIRKALKSLGVDDEKIQSVSELCPNEAKAGILEGKN